ncbi:MAG: hypothetical protein EKK48_19150 [Candidatus Melainabacteria bacterium]|nr:MAG: hypothetical protein EKK48_19150 [Candidatus Melainabacteria bacterium]
MNPGTTPAVQAAYVAYTEALSPLTEWQRTDQYRKEQRLPDTAEHLISGMVIFIRLGNLALAAMDAEGQSLMKKMDYEGAAFMFGDDFDCLMERYHAMYGRNGKFVRAC